MAPSVRASGFELLEEVGRGGLGCVYRARQLSIDRIVAVKVVNRALRFDQNALARFRREAQVLSRLRHPNVVALFDLVAVGTDLLLVMEYVDGENLASRLRQRSLPSSQAIRILADLAAALTHAGTHGIVHRDVKPANIFLEATGRAKLGDFGLARVFGERAMFLSAAGTVMGTAAYMAPEQLLGDEVDGRADAYSFAVVAYELLTGRRPFEGPTVAAVVDGHLFGRPPSPGQFLERFPRRAEQALLAGLDKDPARRPTPAELAAELTLVLHEAWPVLPAHATEPSTVADTHDAVDGTVDEGPRAAGPARPDGAETARRAPDPPALHQHQADGDLDELPWIRPAVFQPSGRRSVGLGRFGGDLDGDCGNHDAPPWPAILRPSARDGRHDRAVERGQPGPLPTRRVHLRCDGDDEWPSRRTAFSMDTARRFPVDRRGATAARRPQVGQPQTSVGSRRKVL